MKNKLIALSINVLVRNVSIKYAVTGIKTATVNIKAVVNHCTSVELIEKSLIIFVIAVINKICVYTDKNAAANVIPTIIFLSSSVKLSLATVFPPHPVLFISPFLIVHPLIQQKWCF